MGKTALQTANFDTYFMQLHLKWGDELVDQTIQKSNVLTALKEFGKFKSYSQIVDLRKRVKHDIISGQTYTRRGKIDIRKHDNTTQAEWGEKHLAWNLIYYYHDLINQGSERLYDVFEEQTKELMMDAPKLIEDQILGSGTPESTDIEGFEFVLSNATNTGIVGRIDRSNSTNDWWRHRSMDFSSKNFATQGLSAMQQMYNFLSIQSSGPNLIFAHDDVYNTINDLGFAKSTGEGLSAALKKFGYDSLNFRNAIIVNSSKIPDGKMYFLTTDDFDIMVNSNDDMVFHSPVTEAERPGDRVFPITKTMNITWRRLIRCGVIHSITVNKQTIT